MAKKTRGTALILDALKKDKKGRRYFTFTVATRTSTRTKKIYQLSDIETGHYKQLSEVEGQYLFHCVAIAGYSWRRVKNFSERLYGFRLLSPIHKGMKIHVAFYERTK